jgi:Uma2 family endonuclease
MMVICKPVTNNNFLDFPPSLVAEVISPSSMVKDRREKYEIYQAQGVKYYIIIEPSFKKTDVFELLKNNYHPVAVNPVEFTFEFENNCNALITFTGLFED